MNSWKGHVEEFRGIQHYYHRLWYEVSLEENFLPFQVKICIVCWQLQTMSFDIDVSPLCSTLWECDIYFPWEGCSLDVSDCGIFKPLSWPLGWILMIWSPFHSPLETSMCKLDPVPLLFNFWKWKLWNRCATAQIKWYSGKGLWCH